MATHATSNGSNATADKMPESYQQLGGAGKSHNSGENTGDRRERAYGAHYLQPQHCHRSCPPPPVPRPALSHAAAPYLSSFGARPVHHHPRSAQSPAPPPSGPKNERSCLGHRETVFGLSFAPCGRYLATASQDSTVRIWNVAKNRLAETLRGHSSDHECLRVDWAPEEGFWRRRRRHGDAAREEGEGLPLLASAGADGVVKVWRYHSADESEDAFWNCAASIDHGHLRKELARRSGDDGEDSAPNCGTEQGKEEGGSEGQKGEGEDPPQVYALQFISGWGASADESSPRQDTDTNGVDLLLTSSDDFLHLWHPPLDGGGESQGYGDSMEEGGLCLERYLTLRFGHLNEGHGGVFVLSGTGYGEESALHYYPGRRSQLTPAIDGEGENEEDRPFGGTERNPDNLVYVFDASYCPSRSLLGVALSDGTLRLINAGGVCVSVLELREWRTHITSLAWDSAGWRLACTAASGHVILWDVGHTVGEGGMTNRCRAVLEGGHDPGRPIFGALFCGSGPYSQEVLLSWGVDGKLCLWDAWSEGHVHNPLALLVDKGREFPIYAVDVHESESGPNTEREGENIRQRGNAAVAVGGGREGGFLGVPVFLYSVEMNACVNSRS